VATAGALHPKRLSACRRIPRRGLDRRWFRARPVHGDRAAWSERRPRRGDPGPSRGGARAGSRRRARSRATFRRNPLQL